MPTVEKVTLSIPDALTVDAKARALKEGKSMSAVVRGFLRLWLDGVYPTPHERGADVQLELIPLIDDRQDYNEMLDAVESDMAAAKAAMDEFERRLVKLSAAVQALREVGSERWPNDSP